MFVVSFYVLKQAIMTLWRHYQNSKRRLSFTVDLRLKLEEICCILKLLARLLMLSFIVLLLGILCVVLVIALVLLVVY